MSPQRNRKPTADEASASRAEMEDKLRTGSELTAHIQARARSIAEDPRFTNTEFIAVVVARSMQLRARTDRVPASLQPLARKLAHLLESFAPLLVILESTAVPVEDEAFREERDRLCARLQSAVDIVTEADARQPCWDLLYQIDLWSYMRVAELARTVCESRDVDTATFDLPGFLAAWAKRHNIEPAACDPKLLDNLYRAWCGGSPGAKALRGSGGTKWSAAAAALRGLKLAQQNGPSLKAQYQRHVRGLPSVESIMAEPNLRLSQWLIAAGALRSVGIESEPMDWETAWQARGRR